MGFDYSTLLNFLCYNIYMAQCTSCGISGAYVGCFEVSCANQNCRFFSADWAAEKLDEHMDSLITSVFPSTDNLELDLDCDDEDTKPGVP